MPTTPNSGVIEGQDLLLYIQTGTDPEEWTPIAHSSSHVLTPSLETRDRLSKDTGAWKGKVAALLGWQVSCEGLACFDGYNYHDLFALMILRTPVVLKLAGQVSTAANGNWKTEQPGDTYQQGSAIITGLPLTAPNNADATFSCAFEGTGELEPKVVPDPEA